MEYISVSDVRYACGIPQSLASNDAIEHAINIIEPLTERAMNTKFKPTTKIDIKDGTGTRKFILDKSPVWRIEELKSDGNTVDVSSIQLYYESGLVELGTENSVGVFYAGQRNLVCKYLYGKVVEDDSVATTSTADVSAGTSVAISVNSNSGFEADNWVKIIGMDGNMEAAQITSTGTGQITVDKLNFAHESGSMVTKLIAPQYVKRFMELEATIYSGLNAIGATYTFNASYSIADLNIQKGVPYTHWKESLEKAIKEREGLRKMIKPGMKMVI